MYITLFLFIFQGQHMFEPNFYQGSFFEESIIYIFFVSFVQIIKWIISHEDVVRYYNVKCIVSI